MEANPRISDRMRKRPPTVTYSNLALDMPGNAEHLVVTAESKKSNHYQDKGYAADRCSYPRHEFGGLDQDIDS